MNDWKGTKNAVFRIIGASNHSEGERQSEDFYATDPRAIDELLLRERFSKKIWECAVGSGNLAYRLMQAGYEVKCSDIIDRGVPNTEITDFLTYNGNWEGDIITNPPYRYAKEFIKNALHAVKTGSKIAMFLKLTALEGKERYCEIYADNPPKFVYVFVKRIQCGLNGKFEGTSAVCYAWFIWVKGSKDEPIIRWIY